MRIACSAAAAFTRAGSSAAVRAAAPSRRVLAQAVAAPAAAPAATATKSAYELQTLTTWLLDLEKKAVIDNELAAVISSIATACKQIGSLVNRAGISNLTGLAGQENVQGEDQKKLDVISNEVFGNCLRSRSVGVYACTAACHALGCSASCAALSPGSVAACAFESAWCAIMCVC
jgi:fructose-1,6-bisphosphatase I